MGEKKVEEISAGVIPYRRKGDVVEYLLLHYPGGHWSFPKGNVEEDEELEEAALRELEEETSISAEQVELVEGYKDSINYTYERDGEVRDKTVYFFAGEVDPEAEVELSIEHEDFWWLDYNQAETQVTYFEPQEMLKKFHGEYIGEKEEEIEGLDL